MLVLTGGYFVVELIVGILVESLALVADAMHMLSDLISLLIGYWAMRVGHASSFVSS